MFTLLAGCSSDHAPTLARAAQAPKATATRTARSVFWSERLPDTVDARHSRSVHLSRTSGAEIAAGKLVYRSFRPGTDGPSSATVPLRLSAATWDGEIAPEPSGARVEYHFDLTLADGRKVRAPGDTDATYAFGVVALRVLDAKVPSDLAADRAVSLLVEAAVTPAATCIARVSSARSETPRDVRLPMSVTEESAPGEGVARYRVSATLPELGRGDRLDFYVGFELPGRAPVTFPAAAPGEFFVAHRSWSSAVALPANPAGVGGAARVAGKWWLGTRGTGVLTQAGARVDLKDGLPSRIVRFIEDDAPSGRTYVGTNRGLVTAFGAGAVVQVAPPFRSAWAEERLQIARAGPGATSPLDGTALVQLQRGDASEILELSGGTPRAFRLRDADRANAAISVARFDAVSGCFLLGTVESPPALVRRCGQRVDRIVLVREGADAAFRMHRMIDVAPAVGDERFVVALDVSTAGSKVANGVFVADASGRLSPAAPGSERLPVPISGLATDFRRSRVLVATMGQGLLSLENGRLERVELPAAASPEITSIHVDLPSGEALAGTSRGAYAAKAGSEWTLLAGSSGQGLPLDAVPVDVDPRRERTLFASYSTGAFELDAGDEVRGFRGVIPEGVFGEARYGRDDEILLVQYNKGLLRIGDSRTSTPSAALLPGLGSDQVMQILPARDGALWIDHAPSQFREPAALVQVMRGTGVTRDIVLPNQNIGTVVDWLAYPEHGSILAATVAGLVELKEDGSVTTRASEPYTAMARDPRSAEVALAGTRFEKWNGKRRAIVASSVRPSRERTADHGSGGVLDLDVAPDGTWYALFQGGLVAFFRPGGGCNGVLDAEDGIPPSSKRVLVHPKSGRVFVGGPLEGAAAFGPACRAP